MRFGRTALAVALLLASCNHNANLSLYTFDGRQPLKLCSALKHDHHAYAEEHQAMATLHDWLGLRLFAEVLNPEDVERVAGRPPAPAVGYGERTLLLSTALTATREDINVSVWAQISRASAGHPAGTKYGIKSAPSMPHAE
jgi:hypothetical protein